MIALIIVGFPGLCEAMKTTVETLVGPCRFLHTFSVNDNDDDLDDSRNRLLELVRKVNDGSGVLIFSDMIGGTASNIAISVMLSGRIEIITGANIPMIVTACNLAETSSLETLTAEARNEGRDLITVASKVLGVSPSAERSLNEPKRAGRLPKPIKNVPSPFVFARNASGRIAIVSGPQDTPVFPFKNNIADHANYLTATRMIADRLLKDLNNSKYNVRIEFKQSIEHYVHDLPSSTTQGNLLLADAEARIIREMFAADEAIIATAFASRLKVFLQQHIGLRAFYPEVARFYIVVQNARLEQPLPQDAVDAVQDTVRDNTPRFFEPEVTSGFQEVAREPPKPDHELPDGVEHRDASVKPPPDPLGEIPPERGRSFGIAGGLNKLYEAVIVGKEVQDGVRGWSELAHKLGEHIVPILDWLRQFTSS